MGHPLRKLPEVAKWAAASKEREGWAAGRFRPPMSPVRHFGLLLLPEPIIPSRDGDHLDAGSAAPRRRIAIRGHKVGATSNAPAGIATGCYMRR